MAKRILALFIPILLASCVSIPKPDWNPGTTAPAPQAAAERPTCTLPAQWAWNDTYKQWICVVPPPCYSCYYGPVWYGPPVIIRYHGHHGHHGHRDHRR